MFFRVTIFFSFSILVIACSTKKPEQTKPYSLALPSHFSAPSIPSDNPLTEAAVQLGTQFFFDPILSKDSSIACSSCHLPHLAFSDSVAISPGVKGRLGFRNAPTLMNTAWLDLINKDGGVIKLDIQAMTPIEDHDEMDISILEVTKRLHKKSNYVQLAQKAYQQKVNPFVITRALASYLRTLISSNSPYDQFLQGDSSALSPKALLGKNLFFSKKTNCSQCHAGFNFTTNQFENNGLYSHYKDNGRQRVTLEAADEGKFRIPTLRNISLTAPYMHDGSFPSLEAVIEHYNTGGQAHSNKNSLIQPLNLSEEEKQALIAFLEALTDERFNK